ncbi:MAG TPA: ATP-binding protein [Polyangiaceae bacterium]|nr:ATP-binding protein [Polyangiaceae bacterium]
MSSGINSLDERVLVLMPSQRDTDRTAQLLGEASLSCAPCANFDELCRELLRGAGAVLLTDEMLAGGLEKPLQRVLLQQSAWSAVPVLLLTRDGANEWSERGVLGGYNHTVVVERPVRKRSLVSALRSALRARRNQYEIRDAILERERQARELRAQEERLRFALSAGRLGSWELDLATTFFACSDICKANYGRPLDAPFTYEDCSASIHPEDRARVQVALEESLANQTPYDIEYRVTWPNGEIHCLMVRGRAVYDASGKPTRIAGVTLDVTEEKRLHDALVESQAELASQAEQLRAADRLKDQFLATLAHELRNPLAPIRTGLSLVCDAKDPEVSHKALGVMQRQVRHMVRLIDDLLDVARIKQGKLELKLERIALASAIEEAIEASMPAVQRAEHTLRTRLTEEALFVDADQTRLAQVISNLLNNASKYTPNGGELELSVRREGTSVVISVSDNGLGVPSECLNDVFQMFNQVDRSLDRAQGGLGIGLALVRTLVEMHGGKVEVQSAGLNRGSTFTVRLPLAPSARAELAAFSEGSLGVHQNDRILVVDDNTDAADLLALMLAQAGYETTAVTDGPTAIEAAQRLTPQIVILDIGLPGMSGYEVAELLRKDARLAGTSLIALTGWGTPEDKRRALAAGFDVHLTKPVAAEDLHAALGRAAAIRQRSSAREPRSPDAETEVLLPPATSSSC